MTLGASLTRIGYGQRFAVVYNCQVGAAELLCPGISLSAPPGHVVGFL